jgi:hypothetical protein
VHSAQGRAVYCNLGVGGPGFLTLWRRIDEPRSSFVSGSESEFDREFDENILDSDHYNLTSHLQFAN